MNFFPQIRTGALAQYPLSQRIVHRTAVGAHEDGSTITLADPDWTHTVWQLTYRGCTEIEAAALEAFFRNVEGRLGGFVFADPWDNLLAWSEDLSKPAWSKGAQVESMGWADDPFGGTGGTVLTNAGASWQGASQTLALSPRYGQCFSLYARSGQGCDLRLFRAAGTARTERCERVGSAWRRLQHAGELPTDGEATEFGVELEPGAAATVFGFQLEPQAKAGPYRRSTTDGGIYREAHFDQDVLEILAEGPDRYATTVRVRAKREAG